MTTAELWKVQHSRPKHQLRYPSEHVVRWLASIKHGEIALDIGCGSGRHMRLLNDFGFIVNGIDLPHDMRALEFDDESFDLALAYGVFYYGTHPDHLQAIAEMHRVLKPGGQGLVVTRTFRDSRATVGEWVDVHTQRMTEGDEQGMLINFLDEGDVRMDYGVFSEVGVELTETTRDGMAWRDSDWIIRVTR